ADNVRRARPDATDQEVAAALERIGVLGRFDSLPEGLETDVQTRGLRLSAGERQLVGIGRVALADPAVIVLDEATSSLDPATEAAVERALAAVAAGRTVVTIAHRLSTAERADRVVVMEHGRVVEVASHDELVEQGERYAELWASWQAGLELTASRRAARPCPLGRRRRLLRRAAAGVARIVPVLGCQSFFHRPSYGRDLRVAGAVRNALEGFGAVGLVSAW